MTATRPTAPARPTGPAAQRVTQARVVRSEWTKLRTLPSTAWSLLAAVALIVGFGALYCLVRVTRPPSDPAAAAAFDPTAVSLSGVQVAQLAVGILGVLLVTGEYATGTIRVSLTAVPRRLPVLWGKAVVFGLTALVLCLPAVLAAFLVGQSILSAEQLDSRLSDPGVARAVLGSALLLSAGGLLGLGPWRAAAQHRLGRRRPVRRAVRPPAPHRAPARHLVGPDLPVPAGAGRRGRDRGAARPGDARPLERVRRVLPLHRRRAGGRRLAAAPP